MGSQHPSPNVKTLCSFGPQLRPENITSRDAQSACFNGSRTSCDVIKLGVFCAKFWPEKITSRDGCLLLTMPYIFCRKSLHGDIANGWLKVLVHNCPRLPTIVVILQRKFPLERGPKRPQKCTIVDNFDPHPQPQNSLLRAFRLQPGLEWKCFLRRTWLGQKLLSLQFPGLSLP